MGPTSPPVLDIATLVPALEKYGAVTGLSVAVYGIDQTLIAGPVPVTPLVDVFQQHGFDHGIFLDCVRQCLAQDPGTPAPVLTVQSSLAVVGVALLRDKDIVGVLVAGYALTTFPESVAIGRLARESGIPFQDLWALVRQQRPISAPRLLVQAELLRILGDALLKENDLRRRSDEAALKFAHMASHDRLTDLPNRALLADRLERALAMARRHHRRVAVLFLDVDRFKHVNDSLGHPIGDELLQSIAREVTLCVRSSDTVARHGGDEFVIVLSEVANAEAAAEAAQKIITSLVRPHVLAAHEVHVTGSIGISVFPEDGDDAETLLARADMALYMAKESRGSYKFFTPELNRRAVERQFIEAGLRGALIREEFALVYQPKVNLATRAVVGAEALIRWQHPDRGHLEPARFVPIAEECGLIAPIGHWVLHEACRQARAWQEAGLPPLPISVNVSAVEFQSPKFLANVIGVLKDTRLDPRYLEIELTERVLMPQIDGTNEVLLALKDLGLQLAIDDFGMGWSSLRYLREFPIDVLKIDKSFVQEITSASERAPIVSAVISMGRSLNHTVVAEGVETSAQLAFLRNEGCSEGQGYYFSRPLGPQQFAELLASR